MTNRLDLASAQLIGFYHGKWHSTDIVAMCDAMGMTKAEWIKLKKVYEPNLDDSDIKDIDAHFGVWWQNVGTNSKRFVYVHCYM